MFENKDEKCQQYLQNFSQVFKSKDLKCICDFHGLKVSYFNSMYHNLSIGVICTEISGIIWCQFLIRILILEKTSVSPIEILKMNQRVFGTNRELLILGSMFKYVSSFQRKKLKLYCLKIFVCCKTKIGTIYAYKLSQNKIFLAFS